MDQNTNDHEPHSAPPITTEQVLFEISQMRHMLVQHMREEEGFLRKAQEIFSESGPMEEVRARIVFVNMLMDREKDRKELRKAIIQKSTVAAIWALIVYIAASVNTDLSNRVKAAVNYPADQSDKR